MRKVEIAFTLNGSGAVTVDSIPVVSGNVYEVYVPLSGTAWAGSTVDITLTRLNDGGTIMALTNTGAPFQYYPAKGLRSMTGGTTAYTLGTGPVYEAGMPCDDHIRCVIAQGTASAAGTVIIYAGD